MTKDAWVLNAVVFAIGIVLIGYATAKGCNSDRQKGCFTFGLVLCIFAAMLAVAAST